jgi:hypothetical protein
MRWVHEGGHPERSEGSRREMLRSAQHDSPEGEQCKVYECFALYMIVTKPVFQEEWNGGAMQSCWQNLPCLSFAKGDLNAPFGKGGVAKFPP